MLYAIFNHCTSIPEVTAGLMACETKFNHLGMNYSVGKSTLFDENIRRDFKKYLSPYTIGYTDIIIIFYRTANPRNDT
jgi:hypothetical protein